MGRRLLATLALTAAAGLGACDGDDGNGGETQPDPTPVTEPPVEPGDLPGSPDEDTDRPGGE